MNEKYKARTDLETWLKKIPKSERHVPFFIVDAPEGPVAITPQEAIDELSDPHIMNLRATSIMRKWGRGLAPLVEQLDVEGCDLILEQVKARNKIAKDQGHSGFFGTLDGVYFSLDDVVENMEKDAEYGKKFRRMFTRLYDELIRKLV